MRHAQRKRTEAPTVRIGPDIQARLAQGMEAAERNAKALKGTEAAVKKVSPSQYAKNSAPTTRVPCYRCGRSNHDASKCRFADATCHNCGEKGHIAPACRQRKAAAGNLGQGRIQKHSMLLQPRRTAPRTTFSCTRLVRSRLAQ